MKAHSSTRRSTSRLWRASQGRRVHVTRVPRAALCVSASTSATRRDVMLGTAASSVALVSQLHQASLPAAAKASADALQADNSSSRRGGDGVPRAQLAPDLNISRIIKGCWQLSGGHHGDAATDRTSGAAAVEDFTAFAGAGITTFDCADHYGPAEALIGRFLRERPDLRGHVQALTKYCVFSPADMSTLNAGAVWRAVDQSRQRLDMQQVDLMQLYWGDYRYPQFVDAARHLADLQQQGILKAMGMTNFDMPRMEAMYKAGVPIASHQVQYSLLDRRPENGMAKVCAAHGTVLLPYGVLAGGFLSDRYLGVPASAVKVDTYSKGKYAQILGQAGGWGWLQELLRALRHIGDKHHGVSVANVAAKWVLQRPGVAAVILGARNASHVADHQALFSFELDGEDQGRIDEVLARGQRAKGDCYGFERGGIW